MSDTPQLTVEIWSDVSCPWCFIGKARFFRALERFPHRAHVEVIHRSFELDPRLTTTTSTTSPEHAHKYGLSAEEALAAEENLASLARAEGLSYVVASRDHGNTFTLHRLLHLADATGRRGELLDAFFAANFGSERSIYDASYAGELAVAVGLDPDEVQRVLEDETEYADAVRAEETDAASLGITGVPFFVIDRRYGVSGAQTPESFQEALLRAWLARSPA